MAIGTTATFSLSRNGIIREACQRVGVCPPDGEPSAGQYESLGTSLQLTIKALALRGVLITKAQPYQLTLVSGTASYALPDDAIDVLPQEMYVRQVDGGIDSDAPVENMSRAEYDRLNQKDTQGRPTRCLIQRATASLTAVLWPVPDDSSTYFISTVVRLMADMNTGATNADMPTRYNMLLVLAVAAAAAEKFGTSLEQAAYWNGKYDAEAAVALADSTERGNVTFKVRPSVRGSRRY